MKKLTFILCVLPVFFVTYASVKYMKFLSLIFLTFSLYGHHNNDSLKKPLQKSSLCDGVIGVCKNENKLSSDYIFDHQIYLNRCDTLAQVKFWRQIMNLSKDTVIISLGQSRTVIQKTYNKNWYYLNSDIKQRFRDSVRTAHGLDSNQKVLVTYGRQFFYDFEKAFESFDRGINCFVANGVDPWYAQAILLIESPNKLQKSNVGAYGPFQLMKDVARMYGLKVNRHIDERANFERSAYAASSLIKTVCLPKTRQMLDSLRISYNENDLWFRLLVMHSYHAGAGNVRKALFSFAPNEGGMNLIYTLWKTESGAFKSASQNYTQLVLAAMLEMDKRVPLHNSNLEAVVPFSGSFLNND